MSLKKNRKKIYLEKPEKNNISSIFSLQEKINWQIKK